MDDYPDVNDKRLSEMFVSSREICDKYHNSLRSLVLFKDSV